MPHLRANTPHLCVSQGCYGRNHTGKRRSNHE
jgi:hypothetical protein